MERVMDTEEAADVLGVSRMRVRQLVAQGDLPARRASGVLLLDAAMVHRRARADVRTGRPLSTPQVWRIARTAEEHGLIVAGRSGEPPGRGRVARSLRALASEPTVEMVAWRLRRRSAPPLRLSAHPSALAGMLTDARLVLSGPQAARWLGGDLVPDASIEAYVDTEVLADVIADHSLLAADGSPNVTLRRVDELDGMTGSTADATARPPRIAPSLLVAADLTEHGDARAASAAAELWAAIRARLHDVAG